MYLLKKSFRQVRKSKSAGVDKITAKEYAKNLDENLYNLYQRLRRGQYVATPVKRIWIDKEGGKKRPIGIPALEDKIVQRAVSTLLNVIYDVNFYDFSHAFRKGHSQHRALHELREKCQKLNIGWIVSADITGLFDNIDHELLRGFIKRRVNDGGNIAFDRQMVERRGDGRRYSVLSGEGSSAGWSDFTCAFQHIPSLCA